MPEKNFWFTPTSYGMVISFTGSRGLLERIYLNDPAVDGLLGSESDEIVDSLSKRGIEPDIVLEAIPEIRVQRDLCKRLCRENSWDLFSLHPLQLSVQLLVHCNARCDFCYAGAAGRTRRGFMEPETVMALKDYAAGAGTKLGMTGGEPLLHPHIMDMLSYREEEVFDTLITNLTPNVDISALAGTGVDLVQVSLHGAGNVHDRILGIPGAYKKALGRMGMLAAETNVATNTVITPANIEGIPSLLEDLARFQEKHGASLAYVRFAPVLPSGTGLGKYGTGEDFFSGARDFLGTVEEEWSGVFELELPLLHPNPYEYRDVGRGTTCPAGATVAVVRLDGRIAPCNQFVDTGVSTAGTFSEKGFWNTWLGDPLLDSMRRGRVKPQDGNFCGGCAYLESMQGQGC